MHSIDILLPVYNGAQYLKVLLDSIIKQDFDDWKLIIRDDCSADDSPEILGSYLKDNPGRFVLITSGGERLGIIKNYERLLDASTADYIMLCDQDDRWLPEKVGRSYKEIKKMEDEYGKDIPLLAHSDLTVVDEDLNILDRSYWHYQRLNPDIGKSLNRLLVQNIVTGCTVIVNRKLKEYAVPFPAEARIHDWWMAITAAAFGRIGYIADPLVFYRQHRENAIGSSKFNSTYIIDTFINKKKIIKANIQSDQRQAAVFYKLNKNRLSPKNQKIISDYANINGCNFFTKRWKLLVNGFYKSGFARTMGLFFFI